VPQKQKRNSATASEQERKFLVRKLPPDLGRHHHRVIEQGYLTTASSPKATEVRVRRVNGRKYLLTVKKGWGLARMETEIELPRASAAALWRLTVGSRVRKVRYDIPYGAHRIELDVYRDSAQGLVTAEVEFSSEAALKHFHPPDWFGKEVTGMKRFANSELARKGWNQRNGQRKQKGKRKR